MHRERELVLGRFAAVRGMGLRHLRPGERRTVYNALGMTAHVDEEGNVRITGILDADLTELLPASWAAAKAGAKAGAREEEPRLNRQLPVLHKGVVSAGHSRQET